MLSPMSPPSFAADEPNPKPFDSQINEDSPLESEILLQMCKKTLNAADSVVLATRSLISDIEEALDAPLLGDSMVGDFVCDDSMVCESAPGTPLFDSSFNSPMVADFVCDDSMVPETEFEGAAEDYGGDRRTLKLEPVSVTAEEMEFGVRPPLSPGTEALMRILLPAYFRLVRSFPFVSPYVLYVVGQIEML